MSKRRFLKKTLAIGSALLLGAGAALAPKRSDALGIIPTAGGSMGEAGADVFGNMTFKSITEFLNNRNEEASTEQEDISKVVPVAFDGMNHAEVTLYNERLKMETEPLPNGCEPEEHRQYEQALLTTEPVVETTLSRQYDRATLTVMAPYYNPASRGREMRERFGDDWVEVTSSAAQLYRPTDLTTSNFAEADAFILNLTGETSSSLAKFTLAYATEDRHSYQDASAMAAFTAGRLPFLKQRSYISSFNAPSPRTNMHNFIKDTYQSQTWRTQIRELPTEIQGLQMLCKQRAFQNHVKLKMLRELELQLLLEAHLASSRLTHAIGQ